MVFVVQLTTFERKPGHMYIECIGLYNKWEDALRAALSTSTLVSDQGGEIQLPETKGQLRALIPQEGNVWSFSDKSETTWWDGFDLGSNMVRISEHEVN